MAIHPRDLPEMLRNFQPKTTKNVNHLHNISDVTEQVPTSKKVSYAFPWPDAVADFGALRVGAFEPCVKCGAGSWVRYGSAVLCIRCALGLPRV
jgi:hypothetical protein